MNTDRCKRDHDPDWRTDRRGYRNCRECQRERLARHRLDNLDAYRKRQREWQARSRARIRSI